MDYNIITKVITHSPLALSVLSKDDELRGIVGEFIKPLIATAILVPLSSTAVAWYGGKSIIDLTKVSYEYLRGKPEITASKQQLRKDFIRFCESSGYLVLSGAGAALLCGGVAITVAAVANPIFLANPILLVKFAALGAVVYWFGNFINLGFLHCATDPQLLEESYKHKVDSYLKSGNVNGALKCISGLKDVGPYKAQFVKHFIDMGDVDNAMNMVRHFGISDFFIFKLIAEKCIDLNKMDQAISVIRQNSHCIRFCDRSKLEALANDLVENQKFDDAFFITKEIRSNSLNKKIAEHYIRNGRYDLALSVAEVIDDRNSIVQLIIGAHINNGNFNFAYECAKYLKDNDVRKNAQLEIAVVSKDANLIKSAIAFTLEIEFLRDDPFNADKCRVYLLRTRPAPTIFDRLAGQALNKISIASLTGKGLEYLLNQEINSSENRRKIVEEISKEYVFPSRSLPSNAYAVLGLRNSATKAEIKNAYKRLTLKHHPDKVIRQPDEEPAAFELRKKASEEQFKKIKAAYEQLI